jgi:hypothetical protein
MHGNCAIFSEGGGVGHIPYAMRLDGRLYGHSRICPVFRVFRLKTAIAEILFQIPQVGTFFALRQFVIVV